MSVACLYVRTRGANRGFTAHNAIKAVSGRSVKTNQDGMLAISQTRSLRTARQPIYLLRATFVGLALSKQHCLPRKCDFCSGPAGFTLGRTLPGKKGDCAGSISPAH